MLLTQEREPILSDGLGAGNNFTISASPKAFEILSSNLYQNKILAVIREITCNAADAHTVAGIPPSRMDVHIPSFSEPHFTVRDYGPGLSNEDVLSLYTTYFRSTKDSNNDLIGGFGLGSKSPFSVADQFTVTSWHGGTKTTYVCYKQDGLPRVNQVSSEQCGSITGMSVSVVAKSSDIPAWSREASRFFNWWRDPPYFQGNATLSIQSYFHPDNIRIQSKHLVNGLPEWAIFKNSNVRPKVMMGLVTYDLDIQSIKGLPSDVSSLLDSGDMFLNMPVGSLSVSPSRETLSYDANTSAVLASKAVEIAREIIGGIKQELASKTSLYEARQYLYNGAACPLNLIMWQLAKAGAIKWQGKLIERSAEIDCKLELSTLPTITNIEKKGHWKNFQRKHNITSLHNYISLNYPIVFIWSAGDCSSAKAYRKIIYNYTDPTQSRSVWDIYLITGIPKAELKSILADKGFPELIDLADLEEPAKAERSTPVTKAITQGYTIRVSSLSKPRLESDTRITSNIDLTGGGIVIPFEKGNMQSSPTISFYRRLLLNGLVPIAPRYLGIPASKIKESSSMVKHMKALGWSFLTPEYILSILNLASFKEFLLTYKAGRLVYMGGSDISFSKLYARKELGFKPFVPEVDKLLDLLRPYKTTMRDAYYNLNDFDDIAVSNVIGETNWQPIAAELKAFKNKYHEIWEDIHKVRPLLQHVQWTSASENAILNYITA